MIMVVVACLCYSFLAIIHALVNSRHSIYKSTSSLAQFLISSLFSTPELLPDRLKLGRNISRLHLVSAVKLAVSEFRDQIGCINKRPHLPYVSKLFGPFKHSTYVDCSVSAL